MRPIPKEAKEITLAVLRDPDLHRCACWEDVSGRPEFNCVCDIKIMVEKIESAKES